MSAMGHPPARALDPRETSLVREKRRVAATSVAAAVFLSGLKLVVGLWTGSLGILAEAAHSLLDLVAAGMTLWAVRASAQPADGRHTYGHGKFENLSALGQTLLLLATCAWILIEAVERLTSNPVEVEVTIWAFAVMGISIVVDISRARALRRVARKSGSQALEADALHFSTDVWSSSVVIAGLAAVWLAPRVGAPFLLDADSVAALVVALIVIWVSLQLGRRSIAVLLDEAPAGMRERIAGAMSLPGIREVRRVRLRQSGPEAFVDVTLAVERGTTIERGHAIADAAEGAIRELLPGADVVVHVEPESTDARRAAHPAEVVRRLAQRHALPIHGVRFQNVLGRLTLELHAELPPDLPVTEAHALVSAFETEVRRALPRLARVVTHIEPAVRADLAATTEPCGHFEQLQTIHEVLAEHREAGRAHDVTVATGDRGLSLTLHWTVHPQLSVGDAHTCTEDLERALRQRLPDLDRVVIHVEPEV